MQTNIIFSNSKYGTLIAILNRLKENLPSGREQLVIVPDKFSLNAEKFIMEYLGISATTQINVSSLDRMADLYCKNLNLKFLSKFGGIMLVQKILLDNYSKLNVFKKSYCYSGFCEELFNNIMLLKSCNVSPIDLKAKAENLEDFSRIKILEIAFIYEEYENYLKDRFYDSANKLTILKKELPFNSDFIDTDIYYAMFDDFTPQALSVIKELNLYSKSQTFGLINDDRNDKTKFKNNVATQKIVSLFYDTENLNISNFKEMFSMTQKAIFERFGTKSEKIELPDDIAFWQASDIQEEIEFVAKSILYLIKCQNVRFNQISISVGDLDKLQNEIKYIFDKYSIPYFIDTSKSLSELLLPQFIFSIFNCINDNYQQKDILSVLKSPFIDISYDKKQNFENYILAYKIENEKIFDEFNIGNDLVELNSTRSIICGYFTFLKEKIKNTSTIFDFCQIIKDFFDFFNLENKLNAICENINVLKLNILNSQNHQSYNLFLSILDELQTLFGVTEIKFLHFIDLLKAGCDSMNVSTAPNGIDKVFIGDANQSIFDKNDYYFFMNCIENIFPVSQNDCGLIVDNEIKNLSELTIEPTIKQINKKNIFNVYNNLFLYKKQISFSYSLNSLAKDEQRASSFINDIMSVFTYNGKPINFYSISAYLNSNLDRPILLNNICSYSSIKNIYNYQNNPLISTDDRKIYGDILYALESSNNTSLLLDIEQYNQKGILSQVQSIMKEKNRFSVSEIEKYYVCPYWHFIQYVLKLKEKPQGVFQAFDIGNYLHSVAEYFYNDLIKNAKKFYNSSELDDKIVKILDKIEKNEQFFKFFKNKDSDLLLLSLHNEAKRMCHILNEQSEHSEFTTTDTEFSFALSLREFGLDTDVEFYGKIDRIDQFGKYFRIIDYKTGSVKFDLHDLYYGRKIQLQLYAYGLSKKLDKLACGIFYMPIKDDYASSKKYNSQKEFYKLDGVMLNDPKLVLLQDDTLNENNLKSNYIPVKFKKFDGNIDNIDFDMVSSKVCSSDEFIAQLNYALLVFTQAIKEIKQGNIEPSPYMVGQNYPCQYCNFRVACGFDIQKNNKFREVEKIDVDETLKEVSNGIDSKSKRCDL